MNNIEKIKELVKEAKELVEEFSNESCSIGEPTVTEVHISEDGLSLVVELNFYNTEMEYGITEVSSIFAEEMEGMDTGGNGIIKCFAVGTDKFHRIFVGKYAAVRNHGNFYRPFRFFNLGKIDFACVYFLPRPAVDRD